VKVTVEFRQASQRAQSGIDVKGTGPGGTVVQVDPKGVTGSARVQIQESQRTIRQNVESFLLVQDKIGGQVLQSHIGSSTSNRTGCGAKRGVPATVNTSRSDDVPVLTLHLTVQ
jgi:hypothetical protein